MHNLRNTTLLALSLAAYFGDNFGQWQAEPPEFKVFGKDSIFAKAFAILQMGKSYEDGTI